MKIAKKKNTKRKILIFCIVALIIGSVALFFMYKTRQNHQSSSDASTAEQKTEPPKVKTKTESNNNTLPNNSESTTTEQIPTGVSQSVAILSVTQSDGKVNAVAQTSSEGTCVFQYTTDGDRPITTQVATSAKQCTNSVPEIQFSKLGTWKLTVTFYVNNEKVEDSRDVAIH